MNNALNALMKRRIYTPLATFLPSRPLSNYSKRNALFRSLSFQSFYFLGPLTDHNQDV